MQASTKWFDKKKGYGFLITDDGKDIFVHHSSINAKGYKYLNEDDIVDYEIGTGNNDREQAINVTPVLTRKMLLDVLMKDNLRLKAIKDADHVTKYLVVDEKNVAQTDEQGMTFLELATYVGFDVIEK